MVCDLFYSFRCSYLWSTCIIFDIGARSLWPCSDLYCVILVNKIQNVFVDRTLCFHVNVTCKHCACAWSKLIEIDGYCLNLRMNSRTDRSTVCCLSAHALTFMHTNKLPFQLNKFQKHFNFNRFVKSDWNINFFFVFGPQWRVVAIAANGKN